jgi:hypothetical protein
VSAAYAGNAGFAASTLLVPAVQAIQPPGPPSSDGDNPLASMLESSAGKVLKE